MYMNKYVHPKNFRYADHCRPGTGAVQVGDTTLSLEIRPLADDLFRVALDGLEWTAPAPQSELTLPPVRKAGAPGTTLTVDARAGLAWRDADGHVLLQSYPSRGLGFCGEACIFNFLAPAEARYYGLGEKCGGLEKSGVRTKFWNTDVWADFAGSVHGANQADPMYVSVPYLIVKSGDAYLGLLLDNACETFVTTADDGALAMPGETSPGPAISLGSMNGQPVLYLIYGPTLPELTRKLQKLVGPTPLPPLWALGHQQCRWGYESKADLENLQEKFAKHKIPVSGLWLDIGYMRGYRVFTVDATKQPAWRKTLAELLKDDVRVVPILDPGVKLEPGFPVYDDGKAQDVYCKSAGGVDYIGMVWPGETVFPDFSRPASRTWWAGQVAAFARPGLHGAWLDMNDPACGHINPEGMLFDQGKSKHHVFHNQYALGMARASREGFLTAHPERRPFLLCRSGFTGTSKYAAIWTGDNHSNYAYLKGCIPATLNLALSGIPFNGPDIGGFGGDTNEELLVRWEKTCFLFPVHRNHSIFGSRQQEPWQFSKSALKILRHYIQLRYRLLPYLYNLFVAQEEQGEALLRPLIYDCRDSAKLPLATISDQFMIGPALMQAPQVEDAKKREVVIPPGSWFDYVAGAWVRGGRRVKVKEHAKVTSLYGREGSVVPMRPAPWTTNRTDLSHVELHVLLHRRSAGTATVEYVWDDGDSFAYRAGKRSRARIRASVARGCLTLRVDVSKKGFGGLHFTPVLYDRFTSVTVIVDGKRTATTARPVATRFTGVGKVRLFAAGEFKA